MLGDVVNGRRLSLVRTQGFLAPRTATLAGRIASLTTTAPRSPKVRDIGIDAGLRREAPRFVRFSFGVHEKRG